MAINPFPPGMRASGPATFSLEALHSNSNAYAEEVLTIASAGTDVPLTPQQVLKKNILITAGASGTFTITLPPTSKIIDALGPTMPRDGSFYFPFYVSNSTSFAGLLTAGDAATQIQNGASITSGTAAKWMVNLTPDNNLIFYFVLSTSTSAAGSGTVTSITATTPIVVTPSPISTTGTVSHADSGVSPGTTGDASHVAQVTVDAKGHVTAAASVLITPTAIGAVFDVSGTAPIVCTPAHITSTGVVSHGTSGVAAGTYGDPTHFPVVTVDANGHLTAVSTQAAGGSGTVTSISATSPIVVTPSPITGTGTVSHANSGVSASTYGDATHVSQITVNASGHVTAASSVLILPAGWFSLADGATITPNCANGPKQVVTLGGNRTIAAPTNIPSDGYELWLLIKQDATGNRTATWNAAYLFFSSGLKTLSTGANAIDLAACVYNQADGKWYCQLSTNAL